MDTPLPFTFKKRRRIGTPDCACSSLKQDVVPIVIQCENVSL